MKVIVLYFPVVYKTVLTLESVDEILQCGYLHESY